MEVSIERQHANTFASQSLDRDEYTLWEQCRSAHRFLTFKGKELFIYKFRSGSPRIVKKLTCVDTGLSFNGGFRTEWMDEDMNVVTVGHAPVMVSEQVFLWHVFDSQVEYAPHKGRFNARLPVAYRCKENPLQYQNEGVLYILERTAYENRFSN